MTDPVRLREADLSDAELLFDWVNAPDSLAAKLRTADRIEYDAHIAWLAERLDRQDCFIWIVESDGHPIGQVRLESDAGRYEVDIYVMPDRRRGGVARKSLRQAIVEFQGKYPDASIVARVKPGNSASCKLFESAGFVRLPGGPSDHVVYKFYKDLGD